VLALDPGHSPAAMMRGQIAAETGNAEKAMQYLEKVPDLDSQPDALRALLRVHLQMGNISEAMPIAIKLLNVHNDLTGIISCGDHLMSAGQHEAGLRLYDQYADRLLADDRDRVLAKVASAPAHLNNNPAALELVLKLYRKAGDSTPVNEVMELLAHALVETGELSRARELYNQLAALEPENSVHAQNYRQVSARLGDDAANRPLAPEQEGQALMVDELEIQAPAVDQQYPPEVARAVRSALTDSELLDSYNLPAKAIAPLESALPSAPRDVLLNQRLASLYARAERYSDAARCCDVLQTVYRQAGHDELAAQYAEMAAKYHERAGEPLPEQAEAAEPATAEIAPEPKDNQSEPAEELQKDTSQEWEEMTAVEPPDHLADSHFSGPAKAKVGDVVGDLLEEIRFYASQGMWEEAQAAIDKCAALATGIPELDEWRAQVEKFRSAAPSSPEVELIDDDSESQATVAALVFDGEALGVDPDKFSQQEVSPTSEPAVQETVGVVASSPTAVPEAVAGTVGSTDDPLAEMVLEIEETLEDLADTGPARAAATARAAMPRSAMPPPPVVVTNPRSVPPEPASRPVVPAAAATVIAPQVAHASAFADAPSSALASIFGEFKQEMEAEASSADEQDPETHYNLGVAFKDMGLLDEAIGELQKVCHAIDRGHPFSHILEAYTWLAQCLLNRGVPQAAVKWYQRALQLPAVDEETRMGVYYEMATAYEAAGNRQAALDNFMEVYANNIDYRDVAERIKTLKA
jgi:tetratricopeptide (TPR) repeat protein